MANWLKAACALFLLVVTVGVAGPFKVEFTFEDVATDATEATQSSPVNLQALVNAVYIDLSGTASSTVDVDVVTSDGRTILSIDDVAADGVYSVRDPAVTTAGVAISNEGSYIPLVAEKIQAFVNNANVTGVTANVTVYLTR